MNKFKFIFSLIYISILFLLSSCSMGYSSENPKHLKYKLADACIESFAGGRFQVMEGFDKPGAYSLWDMKIDSPLFIGDGEQFKKVGTKVYFKHWNGYSILDYKNSSMKEYTKVFQLTLPEDREYFNEIVSRNKENFGANKYILLKKYDDFSSEEKEIFKKMGKEKE